MLLAHTQPAPFTSFVGVTRRLHNHPANHSANLCGFARREDPSQGQLASLCASRLPTASHTGWRKSSSRSPVAAAAAPAVLSAASAGAAASPFLFAISSAFAAALALLMAAAPRWRFTQRLLRSPWTLVPVALAYGVLLSWSWQPDTFSLILPGSLADGFKGGFNPQFFPKLSGIVALFSRVPTAASLWVHLLAVDLFAARAVYFDGKRY